MKISAVEFLEMFNETESNTKILKGKDALEFVKETGYGLRYVKEQTEEICMAAIKNDPYSIRYVLVQSEELCLAAVEQDGHTLQYVKEQTPKICIAAVKSQPESICYVDLSCFDI